MTTAAMQLSMMRLERMVQKIWMRFMILNYSGLGKLHTKQTPG